ncbi:diaminopimelate epimerase, partial [candidate division GN15 bacterium]|nr:diaminopimelate epimerase [candidate division GN15 bacterium]
MEIEFAKYHALGNDFIVIEQSDLTVTKRAMPRLARTLCERRTGVGADGVLLLSDSASGDCKMDVFNADGGWAEKSGNGLRIAGVHQALMLDRKADGSTFRIETGTSVDTVSIL